MSKRIITLIRHGAVDGPAALYGHTDIACSTQGLKELDHNIHALHQLTPVSHIVCSPLIRCAHPAKAFALAQQLPLQIIDELKEMNFGHWDGIPFDYFTEQHWQAISQFWETPATAHAPNGETLQDFAERVIRGWQKIHSETSSAHQLVICHGGVIRIIIAHILNLDWRNASLFRQLNIAYASQTRIEIADHPAALPSISYIGTKAQSPL